MTALERKRTGIRIPYEMNTQLTLAAQKAGLTKNTAITLAIKDWLKKNS